MKSKSLFAASLIALLSSACAQKSNHYTIFVDPNFSPDQQERIIRGTYAWEKAPGASFTIYIGNGNCSTGNGMSGEWHTICVHPSNRAWIRANYPQTDSGVDGWTMYNSYVDGGTTWLAMDQMEDLDKLQTVASHECAHGFGLRHLSASEADPNYPLMAVKYIHPVLDPTDRDIAEWEETR